MSKILILSTNDHDVEGHAYSIYKDLKIQGHDVYFQPLISQYTNSCPNCFCNAHHGKFGNLPYFLFKAGYKLSRFGKNTIPNTEEYCFYNYSAYFVGHAKSILRRTISDPNTIIIGWCDYYISPEVIYDLYHLTKARIVLLMPDAHLIGGGCHYPCNCQQYKTGCQNCPAVKKKSIPAELYEKKMKYLKDIPLTIIGTEYELNRARMVPFLAGKSMIPTIPTPQIPFTMNRTEARKRYEIPNSDFVIMTGALNFHDKRKGFKYFAESLELFKKMRNKGRRITILLPGNEAPTDLSIDKESRIITPGYLNMDNLFAAYYASDIFVSTSIDDSGPYTICYSIACGIPVISFPIGIAINIVQHKKTGYLAEYLNTESVAEGLLYYYNLPKDNWDIQSNNCKRLMKELREQHVAWQDNIQL